MMEIYQRAIPDHIKFGGCDSLFPDVFFSFGANEAVQCFRIFVNVLNVAKNNG